MAAVFLPATNEVRPHMRIDASNIADLSEMKPAHSPMAYPNPNPPPQQQPLVRPAAQTSVSQSSFSDPAIMSFNRRPTSITPTPSMTAPPQPAGPGGDWGLLFKKTNPEIQVNDLAVTVKNVQLADGGLGLQVGNENAVEVEDDTPTKKKRTRTKKSKQSGNLSENIDPNSPVKSPAKNATTAASAHGPGWRQTPMLQSTASFQPFNSLKDKGRNRKPALDGWASEDVTEEMGEFDFENNLAKFDKRTIFDQMRKEDLVDEETRLVSHNRRPKPGTAGGKNLHHSENVLDLPAGPTTASADYWNSEADVGGEDAGERAVVRDTRVGQLAGRASSKSGISKRSQSRKASAVAGAATGGLPLSRVNSTVRLSHSPRGSTPRGGTPTSDQRRSNAQQQAHPQVAAASHEGLYSVPSGKRIETISALQMLNLENVAANEIGFTEELMAENSGRGIAEVAIKALSDPAMKLRFELASNGTSAETAVGNATIVVLAGNNKSSVRALAASRHLRNKNINVVVCLVGIEREKDLLEDLRRQVDLYRNFGGKVLKSTDFFEYMRKGSTSATRIAVSLIIDALLGLTISFDELRIGDQATVYELMEWANRNEAFVLSVDLPTGIDPATGQIAIIDGSQLFIKPRYVVAMGAPKRGLLEAVRPPADDEDETTPHAAEDEEWQLFVADIGVGVAVWKKAGAKVRRGIEFDGKWVLEMEYRGAEEPSDED